jgi:dTDP-4-amino-4,6-dideoxygalactose transaminase
MNAIPQANPLAENLALKDELNAAMRRVFESGRYIQGAEVDGFEREFAGYIGVNHALGLASGTDALRLGLLALGVGAGDEVITVSHTASATAAAIAQCGATPVFVDIDPATFTMNPASLPEAITPKTRAILPVHLYGHPADLAPILQIADRHDIPVLEDCAQAHGAMYRGRRVGSWGRCAAFSFYPTKNLGALGDGGALTTDDPALSEKVRLLREYGWRKRYVSAVSGFNSRLDELQAAFLRVKLRHLESQNALRRHLAQAYSAALSGVITPIEQADCLHVYHLYVIRTRQRDALRAFLSAHGIGTAIHYPVPLHLQPAYAESKIPAPLPVTEQAAGEILSLPLYPQMSVGQVMEVAGKIGEFFYT